jgi:hypothetical protein
VRELNPGGAVAAERGPQPEDHSAGLEEADLVIGLPGPAPAERFVKGARTGQVGDAERHQADPLFHGRGSSSVGSRALSGAQLTIGPVRAGAALPAAGLCCHAGHPAARRDRMS